MAYEPGSFTKELKEAHRNGEHPDEENVHCPICNYREVPEGFASKEEYFDALQAGAVELQTHVDAHERGEHKSKPEVMCIECGRKEG